ncbi:hypothetical protein EGR_09799 [Echinococcus granulosus]|uniref:Uncharacterized protein n=1 Tax=Echinococcus granulosus TaxID=6210 RepID=W6U406_ECHGR|nr:hypothetical protein EGR_09799 [Echinococcus granulosus]EUB55331.1 hypothetical protein EGR_09799 [Echinococcus granulosus]
MRGGSPLICGRFRSGKTLVHVAVDPILLNVFRTRSEMLTTVANELDLGKTVQGITLLQALPVL